MSALHDNPSIYPTLPPRVDLDRDWLADLASRPDDPWRKCWEYVLTHDLTDREGAAFWTGANLAYEAFRTNSGPS